MRKSLLLLSVLSCLTISAQRTVSLNQIYEQWQTRTLKAGSGANIMQLVQVFQKAWPTYSGDELIRFYQSKKPYDNTDKVVDMKNGYVLYSEDDPDSSSDERLQACVWHRSNGHSLLAVNLHRDADEIDVLCFYDYNPQTGDLTPEKRLSDLFKPSFSGYHYNVKLPQKGKDLRVEEFYGALTITHDYTWDGMKPIHTQVSIDRLDSYQSMFSEAFFFAEEHPLTKYALIDVDIDGFPELWLCSSDETYQAVFGIKATKELLGGQDDRRTLHFYRGAVSHSGHCGAGCMSENYCVVESSWAKMWINDIQEYNNELEDFAPSSYTIDGKEISPAEAKRIIDSLGEEIVREAHWTELTL